MKRITQGLKKREPVVLSTHELVKVTAGSTATAAETQHYTVKLTNANIAS
jgi:hypothetical protein